ncbi:serine O-acetyltransferase [Singulisphaera sp. PoT]|uniref:serine O-acetyltransferase n=1 Tax=Singulisphaera sp. PoT TaxID=3411797 RepID=UPI003BF486EA
MPNPSVLALIKEDWGCNSHAKSKFVLAFYRLAHANGMSRSKVVRTAGIPFRLAYRVMVDWFMGIDIPWKTRIGRRLVLYHSMGLVVNEAATLGDDCILRHSVTIGNKLKPNGETASPRIGNRVEFGAGSILLGDITVGDGAVIGAGSVVTKSVRSGSVVVGNPCREISHK